ncbi:MAG: M14 family metallopeptidase [Pseudomonadota bacterium]|nr:M14 family metallopeptidase [Pseudomonadota bacterium]
MDTYETFRPLFLEAARKKGADLLFHIHPDVRGVQRETLAVDVATFIRGTPRSLFINVSAVHGAEGPAGSLIQRNILDRLDVDSLPSDTALVFIHALNPWGFSWYRRETEDNVDLGRNFADFSSPPDNPGYAGLHPGLRPPRWKDFPRALRYLYSLYRQDRAAFEDALTGGQYHWPDGLYYGGNKPTWSHRIFVDILHRYAAAASRIIYLDWHTGLGPYGTSQIILDVPRNSDSFRQATQLWSRHTVSTTHSSDTGGMAVLRLGEIFSALDPLREKRASVIAATHETGTYSPARVFASLWYSSLCRNLGPPPAEMLLEKLGLDAWNVSRKTFFPQGRAWRQQTVESGVQAFFSAVDYITANGRDQPGSMTALP